MKKISYKTSSWHIRSDSQLTRTPIFALHEIKAGPGGDGNDGLFYVLKAPEWINVLPVTPDREVILVEQYRHGIEQVTLEIPGGMVDPGELPLEAAKRELLEETGYRSGEWTLLGKSSSNPAILNNFTHLYLAEQSIPVSRPDTDEFEEIAIHLVSMKEFLGLVHDGTIHHSIVLAAVAKYLVRERVETS